MTGAKPLRLIPQVKEVVWGGRWLADELGRPGAEGAPLGESWEAYSGSVIAEGEWAHRTLADLFQEYGATLFGKAATNYPRFPLLVKFIDAHQNLSIQVHPNNELAWELENYPFGKTEFWYVLEAVSDAEIIYGLADDVPDRETLQQALANQDILRYCARVPVQKGDVIFLPAGTVHALTTGVIIYELQQDSDITYRLYDWGRTDRQIHLEKGLKSIDTRYHSMTVTHPELVSHGHYQSATLVASEFFRSELVHITLPTRMPASSTSFMLLSVVDGYGTLDTFHSEALPLQKGDTLLIPAGLEITLHPQFPHPSITAICSVLE